MSRQQTTERALEQAANYLYRIFDRYRGLPTWGSGMSDRPTEEDFLPVRHRVRDLERKHFLYYGWKSVSLHQAGTPALKYFAPRVLVEAALPPDWTRPGDLEPPIDLAFYACEMVKCNWKNWSQSECAAIVGFLNAWYQACLAEVVWPHLHCNVPRIAERYVEVPLQVIAFLDADVRGCLDLWANDESLEATSHIVRMLSEHESNITKQATLRRWDKIWGNAGARPDVTGKVVQFLVSPQTYSRLERAFFASTEPEQQLALGSVVDHLRRTYEIWRGTLSGGGLIPKWAEEVAREMAEKG